MDYIANSDRATTDEAASKMAVLFLTSNFLLSTVTSAPLLSPKSLKAKSSKKYLLSVNTPKHYPKLLNMSSSSLDLVQCAKLLRRSLLICDRSRGTFRRHIYHNCFVAKEAVTKLIALGRERQERSREGGK